ncbi:hypothetical protein GCM10027591_05540 [Zhihengliuella somnathii]
MDLRMDEAVPLAAALVFRITESRGIRALVLKGPPAVELGMRSRRPSSDVDVLVDSSSLPLVLHDLHDRGWHERPTTHDGEHPLHSVTLYHAQWPCDIDIHYAYPGLEVDSQAAFEALWERRREVRLGGHHAWALDLTATYLIQALHALREQHKPINATEREFLLNSAPRPSWQDFKALAERTGSLGPLRRFISEAFPDVDCGDLPSPGTDWLRRSEVTEPGVFRLLHLQSLPWHQRPKYVVRGLFPSREQLAATDIRLLQASSTQLHAARLQRIGRFLRHLPRAAQQWVRQRRKR